MAARATKSPFPQTPRRSMRARLGIAGVAALAVAAATPALASAAWAEPQTVCSACAVDGPVSYAEAPNGAAVAAWQGPSSARAAYRGPNDDEFGTPFTIATGGVPQFVRAAIGADGSVAVATWLPAVANSNVVARISPSQPTWSTVPAPEGSTNAHVGVGPTGVVSALIQDSPLTGPTTYKVYSLPVGAAAFSSPVTLETLTTTVPQGDLTLASNGLGGFVAAWSTAASTAPVDFQYRASYSSDGVTWGAPTTVATTQTIGNSMSIDAMGNALATYSGATGTESVYRSYLDDAWRNPTLVPSGAATFGFDMVGNGAGVGQSGVWGYSVRDVKSGGFDLVGLPSAQAASVAVSPGGDTLVIEQNNGALTSSWGSTLTPSSGLGNNDTLPGAGSKILIGAGLDQNSLGTAVWRTSPSSGSGNVLASTRPPGSGGEVELTTSQLLTNQRISQAAVLRSNGALDALDAGLPADAFRNGGFGGPAFGSSVPITGTATPAAPSNALGYAVPIPAKTGGGGTVELTAEQLQINQKISQAAVLRSNAVRDRIQQGLTASQIGTGAITTAKLRPGLGFGTLGANAAGTPITVGTASGGGGNVTLSEQQLLINQRISQAAVRRSNLNIAELQAGLTQDGIAPGGIASQNVTP